MIINLMVAEWFQEIYVCFHKTEITVPVAQKLSSQRAKTLEDKNIYCYLGNLTRQKVY